MKDRKEHILLKAFELYVVQGYQGMSITDLQLALDMGRGTLYYHFDGKEDLLRHVVRRFFFTPQQGSMISLREKRDITMAEMIENRIAMVESLREPLQMFENKQVNPAMVVGFLYSAYRAFPELNRKAVRLYELENSLWCRAINNEKQRGIIRPDTPTQLLADMFCNLKYAHDAGNINQSINFEGVRQTYYWLYDSCKLR